MKKILVSLVISVAVLIFSGAKAHAFPTPAEMEANYAICEKGDVYWHQRFGQYLVAFDIYKAVEVCQSSQWGGQRAQLMACRSGGQWLYAGYYCTEINLEGEGE